MHNRKEFIMTEQIERYRRDIHTCHQTDTARIWSGNIENTLLTIGMPPHLLGYDYILSALNMILIDPEYLHRITKGLYFDVATEHHTTPSRVERAMRHAIGTTWLNGNTDYINYLFKNCVNPQKGAPANSLFLARMYYFLSRG